MFPILSEVLLIFPARLTMVVYSEILLINRLLSSYAIYHNQN
jgi:hypothetical protein